MSSTSLLELINDNNTDKNTTHSYLDTYESLFSKRRSTTSNVLEIGIGDFEELNGGSVELWYNYFLNATIHAVDILDITRVFPHIQNNPRIQLFTGSNGYDPDFFEKTFLKNNIKFDIMIDDGPHTLESMKQFIDLYNQVLAPGGIMIIEDVQDISWIEHLTNATPNNLKEYIKVYDLRDNKGRYDDIIFTIDLGIR